MGPICCGLSVAFVDNMFEKFVSGSMCFWGYFANLVSLRMLGKACLRKNFIVYWKLTLVKLGEKRNEI